MAEGDRLTVDFAELKAQVAHYLYGGGLDTTLSDTDTDSSFNTLQASEKNVVKAVVRSGLRGFYNPPPLRQRKAHKWSFLEKTSSLVLSAPITAGTVTYQDLNKRLTFSIEHGLADAATASKYLIELDGISYPVFSWVNETTLTLNDNENPGADITDATYRLHQDDYTLPDDFGRFIGPMTYVEKENAWHSVELVGEGRIRELRQRDYIGTNGSKPQVAAIRNVNDGVSGDLHGGGSTDSTAGNTATLGTHKEIMFWPAVSGGYVLNYKYRVRPQDVTGATGNDGKYPYGASDHSETILYACLAEAERRLDERQGVYYSRFIESLASSVDLDSRTGKAHSLGYNGDGSDVGSVFGREYLFGSRIRHKNMFGTFTD